MFTSNKNLPNKTTPQQTKPRIIPKSKHKGKMAGKELGFNDKDLNDAILKFNGVIINVARHFNCSFQTIYVKINNNEKLKDALLEARRSWLEERLDVAEDVLGYAMSCKEDNLKEAVKASFFVLNQLGKGRGYSPYRPEGSAERMLSVSNLVEELQKLSELKAQTIDVQAELVQ